MEQHNGQSRKTLNQQRDFRESWKAYKHSKWLAIGIHSSFSSFPTWTIWYQYLYTDINIYILISISIYEELQAVNTYHQVLCYPKSVTTKREPDGLRHKLYTVNLYRVLWELDTLSFIMNSCLCGRYLVMDLQDGTQQAMQAPLSPLVAYKLLSLL